VARLWAMRESEIRAWDRGFDDGWEAALRCPVARPDPLEGIDYQCGWRQGFTAATGAAESIREEEAG